MKKVNNQAAAASAEVKEVIIDTAALIKKASEKAAKKRGEAAVKTEAAAKVDKKAEAAKQELSSIIADANISDRVSEVIEMTISDYLEAVPDLPLCQRGDVWDVKHQFDLLRTILNNNPLPPLMTLNGKLIDGRQRTTAFKALLNNADIPEGVKIIIRNYKIHLQADVIEGLEVPEYNRIFALLNNAVAVAKAVKAEANAPLEVIEVLSKTKQHGFFKTVEKYSKTMKNGILNNLNIYLFAQLLAEKTIPMDSKKCIELLATKKIDTLNTLVDRAEAVLNTAAEVLDALVGEEGLNPKIWCNGNALSSILYGIIAAAVKGDKDKFISDYFGNIVKVLNEGKPSRAYTDTLHTGGVSAEYIKRRAAMFLSGESAKGTEAVNRACAVYGKIF